MSNIIPSAARTIAVGKYLVALSGSYKKDTNCDDTKSTKQEGPSGRRKQLHILYLLNDCLHHTKNHIESSSAHAILTGNIQTFLCDLFGHAAAYSTDIHSIHHKKLQDLLGIWDQHGYYQPSYIEKLRDTVANAARKGYPDIGGSSTRVNGSWDNGSGGARKDAPYIMPASHGDPSAPYYDLPAGNMLPCIMPNSAMPINPQLVKPLKFLTGPAEESLATVVRTFLQDVESLDDGFGEGITDTDVDELGQCVLRDQTSGDTLEGMSYYGWSRAFCDKMKQSGEQIAFAWNSMVRDGDTERNFSPRKRSRYSDSVSSRSRSRSSSIHSRDGKRRRNGRRPSSRSRSASGDTRQYRSLRSQSRSNSRSSTYSPQPSLQIAQQSQSTKFVPPPQQVPFQPRQGTSPAQSAAFRYSFPQGIPPLGPGGFPIPPPRPANYQGQWYVIFSALLHPPLYRSMT